MDTTELTCYANLSLNFSLIMNPLNKYHKYMVLIQSIEDIILKKIMFRFIHTFREGNQSVDFMSKLRTSANIDLLIHSPHSQELSSILAMGVIETYFL